MMLERIKSVIMGSPAKGNPLDQIPDFFESGWWQRNLTVPENNQCPTVTACVDAYAQTIAALYGEHHRYDEKGGKKRVDDSDLANILHRPNDYQTRSDLMQNMVRELLYTGNAYLYGERNNYGEVVALHLMRGSRPIVDSETKEVFYSLSDNEMVDTEIDYLVPARNVLHIRLYCPHHPLIGVSPIQHAASAIAANVAISKGQAAFFNNMSRPSGILTADANMTREQITLARTLWEAQSAQMKQGKVPILPGHISWQPLGITSQDAQLVDAFNMSVADIARAFRGPVALLGSYEHSTFNNVEQLISMWLSSGLGFLLEHIELAFDKFFDLPKNEFCSFDTDTLLRTDFAGRIDALTKGVQGGLYTPNEARAKEGLSQAEHGDEPRVQQQVVPLSHYAEMESKSQDTGPTPIIDEDADEDKSFENVIKAQQMFSRNQK